MNRTAYRVIAFLAAIMALMPAMQSCVADAPDECVEISPDAVRIYAGISGNLFSRAYQEQGPVVDGQYCLTYPAANNNYTVGTVDFDKMADVSKGMGIVTTLSGKQLEWGDVGGSLVTFYLDNISHTYGQDTLVNFTSTYNPFKSSVFDKTGGSNDLLWGTTSVDRNTKNVNFDLHHNMARVVVEVTVVHTENSVENISLKNADVRITNLFPDPLSFNRKDGTLQLPADQKDAQGITIVSAEGTDYKWATIPTEDSENADDEKRTYISQDIVLPPQNLFEDINRPRLEIELEDGTIYSGILPYAMLIAGANNPDDDSLNYPVTLSFLKEYVLTIRTVITEEPPELAFMPVWVRKWVDKGEFTLEAHQSGIYSPAAFYKLIEYYSKNNEYQLVRYGHIISDSSSQKWLFNVFNGLVLDYDQIADKMKPNTSVPDKGVTKDFEFNFNNYTVYVQKDNDELTMMAVTAEELYQIVTGSLNWEQLQKNKR